MSHGSLVGLVMDTIATDRLSFLVATLPMTSSMVRPSCSTTLMDWPVTLMEDMMDRSRWVWGCFGFGCYGG